MVSCSLFVFMQQIIFTVKKIHKNCCKQSCSFLAQLSTKSFSGWGFASDPTPGAYDTSPDPLAVFRGLLLRERRGRRGDRRKEGKGKEEWEKDGEEGRLSR